VLRLLEQETSADVPALLSREDVSRTVRQCVPLPYGETAEVLPGVQLRFADAGHLLGSAMVSLTFAEGDEERRLTYTGDLGRRGVPLLRDPEPVPEGDLIVSECTYGGRTHVPWELVVAELAEVVGRTADRGGKVLIPAFTLGRTQVVAACLRRAMRAGLVPGLPIWVDSPLAAEIAEVYRRHPECLDDEARRRLAAGEDPIDDGVEYAYTAEESRALAERRGPLIVIAASAMCDGGRILSHIKQNIDDPRCSIVLVSYQAPDSLGRRLREPRPRIRFHGRDWNLWADVVELNGFSGHADHNDFLDFLGPLAGPGRQVRLVHGEPEQAEALADDLRARGFGDVAVPRPGEVALVP
jgi:metallo-beta-lactamase family protein